MTTRYGGASVTVLLSMLLSVSSACSKTEPPPVGSSVSALAVAPSSASASPGAVGDDPTIAAALEKLSACETHKPSIPALGPDGKLALDALDGFFCPWEVAWSDLVSGLDAADVATRPNHERLARTCVARLGHKSDWVRRAAHSCVAEHIDGVADARATLEAVLAQLAGEHDGSVRKAMWELIGALDPTRHGLAARAADLARKHATDDDAVEVALEALLPKSSYQPTSPEALAFAIEQAKAGLTGEAAVKLVLASALPPREACDVFAAMLGSKGKDWASGLEGMANTDGHCADSTAKAVEAILARTTLAKTTPQAWQRGASFELLDHLGALALDAAAKRKLREALATLSKEQREAHGSDVITQVMENLQ